MTINFGIGEKPPVIINMEGSIFCSAMDVGIVYSESDNDLKMTFVHRRSPEQTKAASYIQLSMGAAVQHWHAVGQLLKQMVVFLQAGHVLPSPGNRLDNNKVLAEMLMALREAENEEEETLQTAKGVTLQ